MFINKRTAMGSTKENPNKIKHRKKRPIADKSKSSKKTREKKKGESLDERIKNIVFKESKANKIRRNVIREIHVFEIFAKKKYIDDANKELIAKRFYKIESLKLNNYLKMGTIPRWMHQQLLEKIKRRYGQDE